MHNKIDPQGAADLGKALEQYTTIAFLDLDHNQVMKGLLKLLKG
jgi:hypothetical protein